MSLVKSAMKTIFDQFIQIVFDIVFFLFICLFVSYPDMDSM